MQTMMKGWFQVTKLLLYVDYLNFMDILWSGIGASMHKVTSHTCILIHRMTIEVRFVSDPQFVHSVITVGCGQQCEELSIYS